MNGTTFDLGVTQNLYSAKRFKDIPPPYAGQSGLSLTEARAAAWWEMRRCITPGPTGRGPITAKAGNWL